MTRQRTGKSKTGGIRREEVSDIIATDESREGGKSEIMTALSPTRRFYGATSLRDPFL